MKTILLTSFHGLISRNIIMAGVLQLLVERGFQVVLLVPNGKVEYFKEEYEKEHIEIVGIDTRLTRADLFLRFAILAITHTRGLSIKKRSKYYADHNLISYLCAMLPSVIFRGARPVVSFLRFLDPLILRSKRFASVFETHKPDLVFLTDLQNEMDVRLLEEAKVRKIVTVGMLRSWDNVSSKGLLRAVPETVVLHNEILRDSIVRQNHIEVSSVVVTGIPHYDHYFHPAPTPKYTFFAEMGLVLEKPLILFAPIGDRYIRDNHVDVAALTELSKLDANILVRLPPMDVVNFEGFESQGAHVVFQTTGTRSWKKEQGEGASKSNEISRKDEQTLIDALSYADVVVVGQSTIVIDAAAFDKPVVLTCFDVDKRDYFDSVRRYFDYEYYDSIHASGGARLAKTREELVPLVEAYLRDPSLDRAGRKRLIEDQAWNTDGNAVSRLVDVLISKISS